MDKYFIDTSSLLQAIRYYFALDDQSSLKKWIQTQIRDQIWLIVPEVLKEAAGGQGKPIMEEYRMLADKRFKTHTHGVDPIPIALQERMRREWFIGNRNRFAVLRDNALKFADLNLLLAARKQQDMGHNPIIITEEEAGSRPRGDFKKIPVMCDIEGISYISLPELLEIHDVTIDFKDLP